MTNGRRQTGHKPSETVWFGPIPFIGADGLYDRHLLFDNIKGSCSVSHARDRYEAFAQIRT